jgi:hypothetical protein
LHDREIFGFFAPYGEIFGFFAPFLSKFSYYLKKANFKINAAKRPFYHCIGDVSETSYCAPDIIFQRVNNITTLIKKYDKKI